LYSYTRRYVEHSSHKSAKVLLYWSGLEYDTSSVIEALGEIPSEIQSIHNMKLESTIFVQKKVATTFYAGVSRTNVSRNTCSAPEWSSRLQVSTYNPSSQVYNSFLRPTAPTPLSPCTLLGNCQRAISGSTPETVPPWNCAVYHTV
jgi:hypothetical protein